MYKWLILPKKHEDNGTEVITGKLGELWLNERHVQQQLGLKTYLHLQKNMMKNTKNANMN